MSAGKTVRQFGRLLSLAVIGSVLIAGVDWTAPNNWAPQDKSLISFVGRETGIAQARYIAPSATSDSENGVCVIYFNPPPASPANSVPSEAWVKSFTYSTIRRWSSQFTDADGRWATPKVEERTINGLPTTVIDTSGRYFQVGTPVGTRVLHATRLNGCWGQSSGHGPDRLPLSSQVPQKQSRPTRTHGNPCWALLEKCAKSAAAYCHPS